MKQKMKLTVLVCALVLIVGLLCGFVVSETVGEKKFDPGCEKLSQMSDKKVFEFVDYYHIDTTMLPARTEESLVQWLRSCISAAEKNPALDLDPYYVEVSACVVDAVNDYYGATAKNVWNPMLVEFDPGCEKLADMTDEKIWEFLDAYTVVVPIGFAKTEAELLDSVQGVIATTERNLDAHFNYNFTDTFYFFNAIADAVRAYYNYERGW